MAAGHLVRLDPEPLRHDAAHERRGEEAVVGEQQDPRRDVRPRRAATAPRAACGLSARRAPGRGRAPGGDVVVVDVAVERGVAGVRPPFAGRLARPGDHRRGEHEQVDRDARADERRGEAAERVRDDDHVVVALADRRGGGVGVLLQAGGVVLVGQVDRQDVMPARAQLGLDEVEVPGRAAPTGDQRVRAHADLDRARPGTHRGSDSGGRTRRS